MLTLVAVVCPPLAVWLTGNRTASALNFGLSLCLYVPGLLHAFAEVDRYNTAKRYQSVMLALERTELAA